MALFIQKPILWNTDHYRKPSGWCAKSCCPSENGYGHEEWNNSPRFVLSRGNERFRVFHTEGTGHAPVDENAGQTFVFMTASHDGIQQLVGIAGNAIGLTKDRDEAKRKDIVRELDLHGLWKETWAVENVKSKYENNRKNFLADWREDLAWIPNWICPDDFYWWLDVPVTLNASRISGKKSCRTDFAAIQCGIGRPLRACLTRFPRIRETKSGFASRTRCSARQLSLSKSSTLMI